MATVNMEKVNKVDENDFHAVKDLSVDIGDGEFMVLAGTPVYFSMTGEAAASATASR